jgi:hypothetical protein
VNTYTEEQRLVDIKKVKEMNKFGTIYRSKEYHRLCKAIPKNHDILLKKVSEISKPQIDVAELRLGYIRTSATEEERKSTVEFLVDTIKAFG